MTSSTGVEIDLIDLIIGELKPTISGNKLPSNLQALNYLFYNTRVKKLSLEESRKIVLQKVKEFWTEADIPILNAGNLTKKLLNLQKNFSKLLQRQGHHHSESLINEFKATLDDLFDIAPSNVAELIDDERMQFLKNQRKKRRVRFIGDDDEDEQKENSVNEMKKNISPRKRKIDQVKPVKAADEEKEEDVDASKKKPKKVAAGSASKDNQRKKRQVCDDDDDQKEKSVKKMKKNVSPSKLRKRKIDQGKLIASKINKVGWEVTLANPTDEEPTQGFASNSFKSLHQFIKFILKFSFYCFVALLIFYIGIIKK